MNNVKFEKQKNYSKIIKKFFTQLIENLFDLLIRYTSDYRYA